MTLPINLPKRNHYKVAVFHQWVRQCKLGGIDVQIVVHQYVDVYRSVVIMTVYRLRHPSKLPLDDLRCGKKLLRRQRGEHPDAHIEKLIGRLEAPRLGLKHCRLAVYRAYLPAQQVDGTTHCGVSVAKIGAEREVSRMYISA